VAVALRRELGGDLKGSGKVRLKREVIGVAVTETS
jgi:hypothetical protein